MKHTQGSTTTNLIQTQPPKRPSLITFGRAALALLLVYIVIAADAAMQGKAGQLEGFTGLLLVPGILWVMQKVTRR